MNEKGKHIRPYSTEDIRRYLNGQLSPAEMHDLEKAAMDDPFLADAMEGMEQNQQAGSASFEDGVADLHERVKSRTDRETKKNKLLPLIGKWRSAAAIILLMGVGVVSYYYLFRNTDAKKAISKQVKTEPLSDSAAEKNNPAPAPVQPLTRNRSTTQKQDTKYLPGKTRSADPKKDEQPAKKNEEAESEVAKVQPESGTVKSAEIKEDLAPKPSERQAVSPDTVLQGRISGLAVQRKRANFSSDSDVVVRGYGKPQRIQKAEPSSGWALYRVYLNKNKKITTADSSLRGEEILSFLVHKNGNLSSFKIEQSLSPAHDAEAIRLIKEGPSWKLLKGNRQRCRVKIPF
jgi:hypothetical protein